MQLYMFYRYVYPIYSFHLGVAYTYYSGVDRKGVPSTSALEFLAGGHASLLCNFLRLVRAQLRNIFYITLNPEINRVL